MAVATQRQTADSGRVPRALRCTHGGRQLGQPPVHGDFDNRIVYIEVVRPERLVYFQGSDPDDESTRFHVTTTFEALGGKTLLTMRSLFQTAAQRDQVVKELKAIEGGNETVDRLAEHLEKMRRWMSLR